MLVSPSSPTTCRRKRTRFARLSISVKARSRSVIASGTPGQARARADVRDPIALKSGRSARLSTRWRSMSSRGGCGYP